ncbi:MAG: M48 family metallopeptidase [Eubacteriales bacterium]|nr:M48 family metallopeptidase [Eubacteriales bacterium]
MNERKVQIKVIRSNRKTISLEINRKQQVILRVPAAMEDAEIKKFLNDKRAWLFKNLKKAAETQNNSPKKLFTSEEIRQMKELAIRIIPPKVQYFAKIIGVTFGKITIRSQKTRWGSCSSNGNLSFNCLLTQAPEKILNYVIIHELCHRIHMNHSKDFWKEVEKYDPDYNESEKWLKQEGKTLIRKMTGE